MDRQIAVNPFLPSWEYIPDGEPHVFNDRLYLFGSHDRFNGTQFCMNDYVCWSAPVDALWDWKTEGIIYRKEQDPHAKSGYIMQAPDVCRGLDGRYYLYYALGLMPFLSVAVSDRPQGPYEYYGVVRRKDGSIAGLSQMDVFQFDPGVFVDEDGRIYLYSGFGAAADGEFADACRTYQLDGAYVMELEPDMLSIRTGPALMIPKEELTKGSGFEGHGFFEASSMRKIGGKYYFIYSSVKSHELCYAVSDYPDQGFSFGGTLISIGDIGYHGNQIPKNYLGNTHGSLAHVNGNWYVFYHRQTNRNNYSRQACAEKIFMKENGQFLQAEMTSCGLNGAPLPCDRTYEARIACNLWSKDGAAVYGVAATEHIEEHPYFTQTGEDRESGGDQYIANMRDGATAGYKYFDLNGLKRILVEVSGSGNGVMEVRTEEQGDIICRIPIMQSQEHRVFQGECAQEKGNKALFFTYKGTGKINFYSFRLEKD